MTLPLTLLLTPGASGSTSDTVVTTVDSLHPQVSVLDLGVTRGDGIFESIGVVDGRIQALEPHLARLAKSAGMLDLPTPDLDVWRAAVHRAVDEAGPAVRGAELLAKLILTRGIEDANTGVTGWVHLFEAHDYSAQRLGIDVVTLDRGYPSDVQKSPWLLQGAKTLSYAVNLASLREAARRGADDVVFVSTDDYVLEGPNSSAIALIDGVHVTTPDDFGVLEGTTQRSFFDFVESRGGRVEYRGFTVAELRGADGVWLASSGRQLAPVTTLDGLALPVDAAFTADAVAYLLGR